MACHITEAADVIMLAGLAWHRVGRDRWTATDRYAGYVIFRDNNERWCGIWDRGGQKIAADWSCPMLETFAEYMVDNARHMQ